MVKSVYSDIVSHIISSSLLSTSKFTLVNLLTTVYVNFSTWNKFNLPCKRFSAVRTCLKHNMFSCE